MDIFCNHKQLLQLISASNKNAFL